MKLRKPLSKHVPKIKKTFDDDKVNNVCSVAPPNETEQRSMIRTLSTIHNVDQT